MVTSPESNGQFMPLLEAIQDYSAPNADRVDAYLTLTERLREEEDGFLIEVFKHVHDLAVVFKRDISSIQIDLCQATLQTLGHCLYQEQISRIFTEQQAKEILGGLADIISSTSDKGVCTRAMWCIAKQNLPPNSFHDQLLKILTSMEIALKKGLQSPTVENEALFVIERFLEQFPEHVMKEVAQHWCNIAFSLTVSEAGKVREHALKVLSSNLNIIVSAREEVVQWLLPALKMGMITELTKLCNEKKENFVLKVWECIVRVLGKALHRSSLINDILKLVEQGFKNTSVSVQVESYHAWKVLIDNFAQSQDVLCTPKRINLIMMPLLNCAVKERNEKVESARLVAWWHFVCSFEHNRLLEVFDKVCVPLLQFIFGTGIDHVSLLKSKEGFGDLKCPPTPNTGKSISAMETPKASARRSLRDVGTPKTPTVINSSFAKATKNKLFRQGCEILVNILCIQECVSPLEDRMKHIVFQSPTQFEKHAIVLINAVREAIKAFDKDIPDALISCLWNNLVDQVERLVIEDRGRMFESYFLPLLAAVEDIFEGNYLLPATSLKFVERLSNVSPDLLNHHNPSLHSKENPQGSTAVLMMQYLLSPKLFLDGCTERLHTGFQNLFLSGMNAPSGQLLHVQATLQIVENSANFISAKSTLWRLWSHVVASLNEYIVKSNEVNQGNALEHDFSAIYLAFMLPVKELLNNSLDQDQVRLVNKDLEHLYRSFSRAAALVSSLDNNLCAEQLSSKFLSHWKEHKAKDVHYLSGMGNLVSIILECLDFTTTPVFKSKSPLKSPSKWAKKIQEPLGNFKSVLHLTSNILSACNEEIRTKKTDDCSGLIAVVLTNIVDNLSVFYQHLNIPSLIASTTDVLSHSLVPILQLSHQSTKATKSNIEKAVYTKRFIQKVEKLWMDILTSVQSRHGEPYNSELLSTLSPLLEVTLIHHRRQLKNQAIQFWNSTFATASSLVYPDNLRQVLKSIKDKACLTLPGWNEDCSKQTSSLEIDEPSQMTQPQGSPVRIKPLMFFGGSPKIKGSFLHKAAEAEKAVEKSSPKKAWTEPRLPSNRRTSTRSTHARRKLPLSVFDDDSQDYVAIAPSPTKKRLLTEHQKDVMREKSNVPTLYNFLDQSQDATFISQETLYTPSPVEDMSVPPLSKESKIEQTNKSVDKSVTKARVPMDSEQSKDKDQSILKDKTQRPQENPEAGEISVAETQFSESQSTISCQETPTKDQPMTSPSHEEMTSPDVIPSSQLSPDTASTSFKSLMRSGTAPVSNVAVLLDDMMETEKNRTGGTRYFSPIKLKAAQNEPKVEASVEDNTEENSAVTSDTNIDKDEDDKKETKSQHLELKSCDKKKKTPNKQDNASPVSGRTRRSRQLKLNTPKSQKKADKDVNKVTEEIIPDTDKFTEMQDSDVVNDCDKNSNQENQLHFSKDTEESTGIDEENSKLQVKPTAIGSSSLNNDVMASPVSCAKTRFIKQNTASPTQASFKAFHSPAASPTTGILKRATGRYDSPSPPNKVRRVSFAQPLAQEAESNKNKQAALPDSSTSQPHEVHAKSEISSTTPSKGSDSSSFTLIKRRRKTPTKVIKDDEITSCIYPDLVDCSLPVEQILPSLTSVTWSRGLGHVVYAQNIRTIGNLSALNENQIRNLPIRSPKIQTLKTALESFHQKSVKGLKTKNNVSMGLEKKSVGSTNDNVTRSIPECNEVNEVEIPKKSLSLKEQENVEECKETDEISASESRNLIQTTDEVIPLVENSAPSATEGDEESTHKQTTNELDDKASFTPPLPESRNDIQSNNENASNTPSRSSQPQPVVLFSDGETQDTEDQVPYQVISKLESKEDNCEQDRVEIKDGDQLGGKDTVDSQPISHYKTDNTVPNDLDDISSALHDDEPQEKKVCKTLKSIVEIATPEVFARLTSEEIFDAHKNLTDLMSRVVNALQSKMATPSV